MDDNNLKKNALYLVEDIKYLQTWFSAHPCPRDLSDEDVRKIYESLDEIRNEAEKNYNKINKISEILG